MRLGSKILLSIFCISSIIAAIGLTANWYSNSIQSQVINNNFTTAQMVEQIASIERGLFQSLQFLNGINVVEDIPERSITMDEPNREILVESYYTELVKVQEAIVNVRALILDTGILEGESKDIIYDIEERFAFYCNLNAEWLEQGEEELNDLMLNTSINPYFRNNLMPMVNELRDEAVRQQGEQNQILEEQLEQANLAILLITSILVLLSISIALYLYRSIANPLKVLSIGANKLGEGVLTQRIPVSGKDEIAELAETFNRMASNLEKRTLARDYLDNIIESIHELLLVTDAEGIIVGLNKSTQKLLKYKREELIGEPITKIYDLENMGEEYHRNIGNSDSFEFGFISKKGRRIPILISESKLINNKQEEVGSVVVATDITQRKRANEKIRESLREKEVLLAEIHHRVKNNLAVISGILQLQTYSTEDKMVIKALRESQSRIQSISLVHEMLYQSETLAFIEYNKYVKDLIKSISKMHEGGDAKIRIKTEIDSISLNLNTAIPCSLMLNEVVMNCYKHAFKGMKSGEIHIQIKEKDHNVEMNIEDSGLGFDEEVLKNQNSLGLTLIRTLTSQLNGSFKMENRTDQKGTRVNIAFTPQSD